ncbi:MAG: hypothetical protein V2A76_17890 [Planctomycetota bacterium]
MLISLSAPVLACALSFAAPAINWQPDVATALEAAKAGSRPIFVAINMDGERANDEMVRVHYRDAIICKLCARTVNLFASRFDHGSGDRPCPRSGTITCAQHMEVEKQVRKLFLADRAGTDVIAPQHIFVGAEGKILLSVPYSITVGQLEWGLVTAIQKLDPEFPWSLSGAARPPRRLVMEGVAKTGEGVPQIPPTKEEITEIISRLKKASGGREAADETFGMVAKLLASDDKRAMEYVTSMLHNRFFSWGGSDQLERTLHTIGQHSPSAWWQVVEPFLSDARLPVRCEAAVALEQLAEPKSLNALLKQWNKEEESAGKKELIRAIASAGADSKKACSMVRDQARRAREIDQRASALVAAARLNDRELVQDLASEALASDEALLRAAAAYVIAIRREMGLKTQLEEKALLEEDPVAKSSLEAALEVFSGQATTRLDPTLRMLTGSTILRDRL